MPGVFQYGAVVLWEGFVFKNGGSSDKLLIILGTKQGKEAIALLTTSQPHGRGKNRGCHVNDGYFFIPAGEGGIKLDTWVETYRPQEISAAQILKGSLEKAAVSVVLNLPANLANEIRNCLKRSKDITPHQASLLE